ncbi:hypothetical protein ACGF5F_29820 [Streptomyces sp. NPDC047821]|uniref:hypothetical protein n=1 Tax=Streptomyces sp. NPDC047821 TaxID=3365488 RepID=UPI0037150F5F
METDSVDHLLARLRVDDRSIRLDCTPAWLRAHRHRLAVCGVHLATPEEVSHQGFTQDAIVPDAPLRVAAGHGELIARFVAAPDTPAGLCLGFGRLPDSGRVVADARAEARAPGFAPHHGSRYRLGPHTARLVDVLSAPAGSRTTTVVDPRLKQYSERLHADRVGLHYDNVWTSGGEGERFPRDVRVASADRRVIHNMGPGPRSLVVALTMSSLHLSDRVSPGDGRNIPTTRQLRDFLTGNPDEVEKIVCVVWTIEVGELVVLPAGIALHDGSMEGRRKASDALVFAGHFPRRAFFEG